MATYTAKIAGNGETRISKHTSEADAHSAIVLTRAEDIAKRQIDDPSYGAEQWGAEHEWSISRSR